MNNIFITGANGNIGTRLIKSIVNDSNTIYALCKDKEKFESIVNTIPNQYHEKIVFVPSEEINLFDFSRVDIVLHLAFARAKYGNEAIADSLSFSLDLFTAISKYNVKRVINVSSQGVYGMIEELRRITMPVAPNTTYSMAKYATEKYLECLFKNTKTEYLNVRLDNVIQSQNLIIALCKDAKYKRELRLQGGKQVFSYIDIEDAVSAIKAIIGYQGKCKHLYNVGPNNKRYSLIDIAHIVSSVSEKNGFGPVNVNIEEKDICMWAGMDTKEFMDTFNWAPKYDINQMVENIFKEV